MSETPRACEYCGQSCIEPQRIIPVHDTVGWVARCGHCQAQGPMKDTPEQAIAAWNQRSMDAELQRLRDRVHWLEGQNKRLQEILDGWQVENYGDY